MSFGAGWEREILNDNDNARDEKDHDNVRDEIASKVLAAANDGRLVAALEKYSAQRGAITVKGPDLEQLQHAAFTDDDHVMDKNKTDFIFNSLAEPFVPSDRRINQVENMSSKEMDNELEFNYDRYFGVAETSLPTETIDHVCVFPNELIHAR